MNNSVLGETMENIKNHRDIKLVTNREKDSKYVIKSNFQNGYPFWKKLFAVEIGKTKIKMSKLVYLGQKMLGLSKMVIYEFHYNYMQPKYGSKVKLCYLVLCIT